MWKVVLTESFREHERNNTIFVKSFLGQHLRIISLLNSLVHIYDLRYEHTRKGNVEIMYKRLYCPERNTVWYVVYEWNTDGIIKDCRRGTQR